MRDLGLVELSEPFARLLTQGMVLNHIYYRAPAHGRKQFLNPAEVEARFDADGTRIGGVLLGISSRSSTAAWARCPSRRTTASIRSRWSRNTAPIPRACS